MTTHVVHFAPPHQGLGATTACGVSLHGWNLHRPKLTTEHRREVSCKRCLFKMEQLADGTAARDTKGAS